LKVGLEKLESHEGIVVKALLVRNVDGTANVEGAITHQVECNMFFKGHMERARMDVYNLGKTELILGMPWLAAYNPEIDWEKGEVKMMCCPPICRRRKQVKEKKVKKMEKNEDEKVLKRLVPRRFWKWKKVFGKKESERMPVQKIWDHAIELKKGFMPRKGKVYSLSREKREEVQTFVEDQLRKGYI